MMGGTSASGSSSGGAGNPFSSLAGGVGGAAGGAGGGGNPFASMGGSDMGGAPNGQTNSHYVYDFSKASQDNMGGQGGMSFIGGSAPGGQGGAAGGINAGGSGSAGGAGSLLAQSPFGSLLNLPGVTADNLFSNVDPSNTKSL